MSKKEWAHELADVNEAMYDIEEAFYGHAPRQDAEDGSYEAKMFEKYSQLSEEHNKLLDEGVEKGYYDK